MKIIKRSGSEDIFDAAKIVAAIRKANDSVLDYEKLTADQIEEIASNVETAYGGEPAHEQACLYRSQKLHYLQI